MRFMVIAISCMLLSACAIAPPKYTAQPQNQSTLRNGEFQSATVGPFTASDPELESLTIRGNTLQANTGSSSGDIREALELELSRAGLLSTDSAKRITGTLMENELDGRGFSEGRALIAVEFAVHSEGREVYRATTSVQNTWESSFAGAKAIPAAAQGYMATIEKLIAALVADPAFQEALR